MKNLTKRQSEVLDFIKVFIDSHKYPPTIREIAGNFEISVKGAYDHVKALEKKDVISCDTNRSRAIEIRSSGSDEEMISIPVLGNVAAGLPLMASENFDGYINLPSGILKQGDFFALYVKGDSMINAGILDGDTAIIKQKSTAENGEIIVALIDDSVTLKRFYKESSRVKLMAENDDYSPIYTQNIRILGKLVKILRDYE
ncbi:transcriptional repressor LexA [Spirochaeta isovalerica]|uniref:LexA repressor n=1 Tax=Spirochaeta isovalerica TaxID=150 RepID=A0A841RHR5_9SPIO|nr:transcriptional repressor LexA [Spirochaeta isovalerica]MBB6482309.1 repressor LexA [Spirochaeta isovalerica]